MSRRGETRQHIVDAAQRLFAQQGFRATTVAEISAEVGLSPSAGGIYRHFESKAALLDAVIDQALARIAAASELKTMASEADLPVAEEVTMALAYLLRQIHDAAPIIAIFERDLSDLPQHAARVRRDLLTPVLDELEDWIDRIGGRSPRPASDPAGLARVVWGALVHRGTSAHSPVDTVSEQRFVEACSEVVLSSLGWDR